MWALSFRSLPEAFLHVKKLAMRCGIKTGRVRALDEGDATATAAYQTVTACIVYVFIAREALFSRETHLASDTVFKNCCCFYAFILCPVTDPYYLHLEQTPTFWLRDTRFALELQ